MVWNQWRKLNEVSLDIQHLSCVLIDIHAWLLKLEQEQTVHRARDKSRSEQPEGEGGEEISTVEGLDFAQFKTLPRPSVTATPDGRWFRFEGVALPSGSQFKLSSSFVKVGHEEKASELGQGSIPSGASVVLPLSLASALLIHRQRAATFEFTDTDILQLLNRGLHVPIEEGDRMESIANTMVQVVTVKHQAWNCLVLPV